MRPIVAATTRLFPPSSVTVTQLGRVPLVAIVTETGRRLVLAPETAFAFDTSGGNIGIEAPRLVSPAITTTSMRTWLASSEWGPPALDGRGDPRLWFIAGLVFGSGYFTSQRSTIPARFNLRHDNVDILDPVVALIESWGRARGVTRVDIPKVLAVKRKETWNGIEISSTIIDRILNGPCDGVIRPSSMEVSAVSFPDVQAVRGFFAGLVSTMSRTVEGRRFTHRHREAIEDLNILAYAQLGVPTMLRIHPHEPAISNHRGTDTPHTLLLAAEHETFAAHAGILLDRPTTPAAGGFYDKVVTIVSVGDTEAVEVRADAPFTADGVILHPEFEPAPELLDIATMTELFAGVTDKAAVLARSYPHRTHSHGEL